MFSTQRHKIRPLSSIDFSHMIVGYDVLVAYNTVAVAHCSLPPVFRRCAVAERSVARFILCTHTHGGDVQTYAPGRTQANEGNAPFSASSNCKKEIRLFFFKRVSQRWHFYLLLPFFTCVVRPTATLLRTTRAHFVSAEAIASV